MSTVTEHIIGFVVHHPDGPSVTATVVGDRWTFNWPGKNSGDDRLTIDLSYQRARLLATALATRLANLEPLRQAYEGERRAVSAWLREQVRGE